MGEHKLREVGNGDGETKPPLGTHIVEVIDVAHEGANRSKDLAGLIELGYTALSDRAKREDSFIINVIQSVTPYVVGEFSFVLVTLVAQRVGRDDLEKQQRLHRMQGGGR
jgi:hypothetical protein